MRAGAHPVEAAEFASLLEALGPFGPAPHLAVAVSGGADSTALALLADGWARHRGGRVTGLIVDHGLRAGSAAEAADACARLARAGLESEVLILRGLVRGPALAARARAARMEALLAACAERGLVHLLLAHHAADQAETVLMRERAGSGIFGLAGMPASRALGPVRLLRPLLTVPPARLRALLRARGISWVEDPSNADPAAERARVRAARLDRDGTGPATAALVAAAREAGAARDAGEQGLAAWLAARARLLPEGYATLAEGAIEPAALGLLLRTVAGAALPPSAAALARLAAAPRAATLGGARLIPARRGGWLVARERRAMAPPVPAVPGAEWDGRFRLSRAAMPPAGATIGALGAEAAAVLRRASALPAAVLSTLPAIRLGERVVAVPSIGVPDAATCARMTMLFRPPNPTACAPFGAA